MAELSPQVRGDVLRERREAAGLSQEDLAYQVRALLNGGFKVTAAGIGQYERGASGTIRPNLMLLVAISEVLDCALDDITTGMSAERDQVAALFFKSGSFRSHCQASTAVA
jgi:transcriptional regulator with XRE-family HTH domain